MPKIIKIEPVPKYYSLTWMLGSFCNYDCMYCPTELHDASSRPHDLDTMQIVWRNIYEKTKHLGLKYKISFTGGEVTANKNFLPLVEWLRNTYDDIAMIVITTNGSASANYYGNLAKVVESISFSTHSEFMNEQEFFNKTIIIHKLMFKLKKSFHINIMNEYWNQERIELYKKILDKHKINYSVNEINYLSKIRDYTVNKGQQNLESI
jgi:MoaA/NifB/PqqE/SkfB family radical SAM enzyme